MLREELTILKSMWTQPRTTFEGTYYQLYDAINEPKPIRQPHPEVLVALGNKKFLPPVAAEFATRVNLLGGDDHQIAEVIDVIADHCKGFGRSRSDIIIGRPLAVLFTDGPVLPEGLEARSRSARGSSARTLRTSRRSTAQSCRTSVRRPTRLRRSHCSPNSV